MISFANVKDPIQSFLSYSPIRFFIQRLDFIVKNEIEVDFKVKPSIIIFTEHNEMVENKLKELDFEFHNENTATYISEYNCYLIQFIDDLDKKRLFNDLFNNLLFKSYEEENQFFEYVKSIDDGSDLFYVELREKINSREDALKLMDGQLKD